VIKKRDALRWSVAAVLLVSFIGYFVFPYVKYPSLSPLLERPGSLSLAGLIPNAGALGIGGGSIAMCIVAMAVTLAECALLCFPKRRNEKGQYLTAVVMGVLSFAAHIFWLFMIRTLTSELRFGFYINLALLIAALVLALLGVYTADMRPPQSAKQSMSPVTKLEGVIIGKSGMYKNATIRISNGEELIVGRDAALAHIIVDTESEKVSRRHCKIAYDGERMRYYVTDYSSNGTYKEDGTRLASNVSTTLSRGAVIYLGNKRNSFLLN
jgi:hypothetical protein